jgi:tetratricopeptide (TPR) repeat protein
MKAIRTGLWNPCFSEMLSRRTGSIAKSGNFKFAAILNWTRAAFCALAIAILAFPCRAQKGGYPGSTGPNHGAVGGPIMSSRYPPDTVPASTVNTPSRSKPGVFTEEDCLPWDVSEGRDTSVSVTSLKVPSNARSEYEKACEANNNNKFGDAELHLRSAIDKFQTYPAAWVMLGIVLEEQNKGREGRGACDHAVTVDSTYLPAYLCQEEISARNREWQQVLNLANLALDLNSPGDGYAYYYRAAAFFHLKNIVEAKKSALQASEMDVNHNNGPLSFLLAQIYAAEGDKTGAEAQLRLILKRHTDRRQEDAAKQFLAKLESQADTK